MRLCRWRQALGAALIVVAQLANAQQVAPATPLQEWKGEFFQKKQGGLYVRVKIAGFKGSPQTGYFTAPIQIYLYDILTRKTYVVSYKLSSLDSSPLQLWKLPAGKYLVQGIALVDMNGNRRAYTDNQTVLVIRRHCLSNLGLWLITPSGQSGLSVKLTPAPNAYTETSPKKDSSVAAVINGFNGLIQTQLAGARLFKSSQNDFSSDKQIRASATITRQIGMFYKLDLFKHNYYAPSIASILNVYDPNMRECYTRRLETNDKLKGDVRFTFLLSKQNGSMIQLKYTGGLANDPKLIECMYYHLRQIQFPVKENMLGELVYTYDVK